MSIFMRNTSLDFSLLTIKNSFAFLLSEYMSWYVYFRYLTCLFSDLLGSVLCVSVINFGKFSYMSFLDITSTSFSVSLPLLGFQ